MNGYDLSRAWFDFAFENQDVVTGNHAAIYFWNVELANRMGWVEKFGSPASQGMAATGIKSYNTYKKCFDQIVAWGFIKIIKPSVNQYQSNIIALSIFDKALYNALDKSLTTHLTNQSESTVQSTVQSTSSINKPETTNQETTNHKPQTNICAEKNFDAVEEKNKAAGFWAKPASQESGQPIEEKKEEPSSKVPRKVSPAKSPEEYTLVHQIKLLVEKMQVGYYWQAKDAANAKSLIKQMTHSFKIRNEGSEPTNEELINSFLMLVDLLPPFYADKWDMGTLTGQYNAIIKQIRENANKAKTNSGGGHKPGNTKLVGIEETLRRIAARYPPNDQPAP